MCSLEKLLPLLHWFFHANFCASKSWKRACPGFDPVMSLKYSRHLFAKIRIKTASFIHLFLFLSFMSPYALFEIFWKVVFIHLKKAVPLKVKNYNAHISFLNNRGNKASCRTCGYRSFNTKILTRFFKHPIRSFLLPSHIKISDHKEKNTSFLLASHVKHQTQPYLFSH